MHGRRKSVIVVTSPGWAVAVVRWRTSVNQRTIEHSAHRLPALPDAVASGVDTLTSHTTASCVVRLCQSMDAEGTPMPTQHPTVETSDLYRAWLLRNFVWTPGAAMFRRRSLVEIGGFDPAVGPVSDYALYLTLAHAGTVLFDRREVVRYRRHDEAMSSDPVLMLRSVLEVLDRERVSIRPETRGGFQHGPPVVASVLRRADHRAAPARLA